MTIHAVDPRTDARWEDYTDRNDGSCFFHRPEWAKIIESTYGFTPCYLIGEDVSGKIASAWPFFRIGSIAAPVRLVCLPFTDYCWPLFSIQQEAVGVREVLSMIRSKGDIGIEIRGGESLPGMVKYTYYKRSVIDLTGGAGVVWRHASEKSIRYSIKKAERDNVAVISGDTERELKQFYRLNVLTRRHHGVIPQPYRFFKNLYEEILRKRRGFLLLAKKDDLVTGGSIFLIHKDTIYHKYNASHPRYKHLCSTHLIIWQAILWAIGHGLMFMDLGRTAPDNAGLMSFKRHWGALETELPYYYHPKPSGIIARGENNIKYRRIKRIINRTPSVILSKLGAGFYRFTA